MAREIFSWRSTSSCLHVDYANWRFLLFLYSTFLFKYCRQTTWWRRWKRMDSWRHSLPSVLALAFGKEKLFANVSDKVCVETMRECLLFFKWWRHILHINNHLGVPQHEFRMSSAPSSHEMFFPRKICGKCEWLGAGKLAVSAFIYVTWF